MLRDTARAVVGSGADPWTAACADLWPQLDACTASVPRILILVDPGGFGAGDPSVVDAASIERLIDRIKARRDVRVDLASSSDGSRHWAGNRDIYALAELLGYRFGTDDGHDYDFVDLAAETRADGFAPGSALAGMAASSEWADADIRILVSRLRTDPHEGFAAGLTTLFRALPSSDADLHYRYRRETGAVVSALLEVAPPHFSLVDAVLVAHGDDGQRAPRAAPAGIAIGSNSVVLADLAAALKLGVDPFASPVFARVLHEHALPPRYRIDGDITPIADVAVPSPLLQASAKARATSEEASRLLDIWLQQVDPALFPMLRPLDARANAVLASVLAKPDSPTAHALLILANIAAAAAGNAARAWRTLFAKDELVRRVVSLGLDPGDLPDQAFALLVDELESLWPIAAAAPSKGEGLRWRRFDGAILFEYVREIAVPFDRFVAAVDVSRTISFMNDYLGGVIVPIERDEAGRPTRQAERNLYLPQPNYLVLYGGQPIDVTKIELARYEADEHRLYWKTLHSENGSASADDGVVAFARDDAGTRISIMGKQRFTLPTFWKVFDISLLPSLDEALTTDAYRNFFDRTFSNFEALVEGRDIRIGRDADVAGTHPSIALGNAIETLVDGIGRLRPGRAAPTPDSDGFVHMVPAG